MSKYLKNFEGHNDYDSYINNSPNLPNVSCCTTPYHVHYNPLPYPHMDIKIKNITNKSTYQLGDTIENRIFIYNNGNKDIINLEVETNDGTLINQKTIRLIPTGCYFVLEAAKTVTEEMILSGDTTTHYTIDGVTYENEPVTAEGDSSSSIGKPNGHLSVYKVTTTEAPQSVYALGDTIEYKITVTNDGNLTITDITVTDELTEDEWPINSLAPGQSVVFPAEYIVKEKDILAGEVVNVATATGTSPDPNKPDVAVTPGEDPEPTEDPNGYLHVELVTTSETPEGGYALNDTVTYDLYVVNEGNLTITDIELYCARCNFNEKIASLAPGASSNVYQISTTVTEGDILSEHIINEATATGTSPDPYNPNVFVGPGNTDDEPEDKNGHLTVNKVTTSAPANGHYALGERISYKVTVTNMGNLTITNIRVTDDKTGDRWDIDSLVPGDSREFKPAPYAVTEADIIEGVVVNVATAKGTSPDYNVPDVPVDPGVDYDQTESQNPSLEVNVETTSEPANGESYAFGETIEYKITITNNGNLTITNITLEGGKDYSTPSSISLPQTMLGIDESMTVTHSVIVTTQDVTNGYVKFYATADGYNGGNEPTDPGTDEAEDSTYTPIVPGE